MILYTGLIWYSVTIALFSYHYITNFEITA